MLLSRETERVSIFYSGGDRKQMSEQFNAFKMNSKKLLNKMGTNILPKAWDIVNDSSEISFWPKMYMVDIAAVGTKPYISKIMTLQEQ